jgi:hypothetical protein
MEAAMKTSVEASLMEPPAMPATTAHLSVAETG